MTPSKRVSPSPVTPAAGEPADRMDEVLERLGRLETAVVELKKTHRLVAAVARRLFLEGIELPPRKLLRASRFGDTSQNEEDGLLLEVFRRIGVTDRRFVEIGCGVNGGNSGFLARECGWGGLMIDGRSGAIDKVSILYASEDVVAECHLMSRENINSILEKAGFTGEIDLLSIDVDGNDFWLWDALTICRPRVVIIEYNYLLGPTAAVTIPYAADFRLPEAATRAYRGASIEAMVRLGKRLGYRLITSERINAVFLRDDVPSDLPTLTASLAHQAPANRVKDVFGKLSHKGLSLVPIDEQGQPGAPVPAESAR
jgi:hypothetical protein